MTEDEAFIRMIVDSPGDEGPRLVYADWLEERGDPRGAYLRAECEAVKTGDPSAMQRLALGLDAVWVARVSLPPIGVCWEHVEFLKRGPSVTAEEIANFEQRSGFTLPHDYRAFLLNYNGGIARDYRWVTPDDEPIDSGLEHVFYPLKPQSTVAPRHWLESWAAVRHQQIAQGRYIHNSDPLFEAWFSQFLDVGQSPDLIFGVLLGIAGPEFGQVRYFDYSVGFYPGYLDDLGPPWATSFAAFLAALPDTGYP
jgi:uncharacterized protein (TIGR02996 family)